MISNKHRYQIGIIICVYFFDWCVLVILKSNPYKIKKPRTFHLSRAFSIYKVCYRLQSYNTVFTSW